MDDAPDRRDSRAPELEDLAALCRALNESGARYLLIGGFAVILQGFVRTTKDIDLLVEATPENLAALKRALASLPDNAAADVKDDDLQRYAVVRVADEIVVDLMASACGVDYLEARSAGVDVFEIAGVPVPVAKKRVLIRTKQTLRPQDALDREALALRLAGAEET